MTGARQPVVLIVEDESDLADLYSAWLGDHCAVRTAYDGDEAVEAIDETIDIVLLDRRMPGLSGDEVLDAIQDRGIDCKVAMVTAVEPDFDIVEMGFDDYLVKPVSRESLIETVEGLLRRDSYDDGVQELFSLASKKAILEAEKDAVALENNEEYQELSERVETLRAELDQTLGEFDDDTDVAAMYRDIGGDFEDAFEMDDGTDPDA